MADPVKGSPARRVLAGLLVLVLIVAAAGAGWWASRATLTSAVPEGAGAQGEAQAVWAQAATGAVGRSLPLSTTLRQPAVPVAQMLASMAASFFILRPDRERLAAGLEERVDRQMTKRREQIESERTAED